MPRKEGTKAKVGRKPPRHAAHTPRNSWTSPAKLARRKRINEALAYREQGHSFPAIAKQMIISLSTAHDYVVEGMNAIPLENARQVLAMELTRLDALLAAHYATALTGDASATALALRVIDQRARLLGLYPEYENWRGAPPSALPMHCFHPAEFVVPSTARSGRRAARAPYPWQKSLPPPEPICGTPSASGGARPNGTRLTSNVTFGADWPMREKPMKGLRGQRECKTQDF
jgi:hypothetical protein